MTRTPCSPLALGLGLLLGVGQGTAATQPLPLRERLQRLPYRIAYECYTDGNWEIFSCRADGSDAVNLTRSPGSHEHYPQVSPDGRWICFLEDRGEGRETVRSLWVMGSDGRNRRKLLDSAREPFWSPDGTRIGFLHPEFPKFNVMDYYTHGMSFVDLASGRITDHPNSARIHHLYNPCFAPGGGWILATAHAGMGVDHGSLLLRSDGPGVVKLGIPGCRGWISPSGREIAWGAGDYEIAVAPIDLAASVPSVGERRLRILDHENRVIHVDWSPDGGFLCFSRGPAGRGDAAKPGTFAGACGIVGVYAAGWNLCVVPATLQGSVDLLASGEGEFMMVTTNGFSNKEPAWFLPPKKTDMHP